MVEMKGDEKGDLSVAGAKRSPDPDQQRTQEPKQGERIDSAAILGQLVIKRLS